MSESTTTTHPPSSTTNIIITKYTFHHQTFPTCNFFKLCDQFIMQLSLTRAKNARIKVDCSILQCPPLAWMLPWCTSIQVRKLTFFLSSMDIFAY